MRFLKLLTLCIALSQVNAQAQKVPIVSQDEILKLINSAPDSGYLVINFWATWCGPCIDEIPYFVKADTALAGENYTFVFVNLDFLNKNKSVGKFVQRMKMPGTHYQMRQDSIEKFIEAVDPKWQGSIPMTVLVSKNGKRTHEGSFYNYKDLWNFIRFD